ncbi:MAG: hypothetical protein M3O70_09195 [Actinomycetota bacterium]|nr:hypothetical protein [Actinomycetota bacterium]
MAETAAVTRAKAALNQRFPGLRMQVSSCRKIARSSSWSQHAFNNAIDIFASKATLDMVAAFLRSNKAALSVNNVLWRVRDHFDHCHVDFHPKGIGVPACAGGKGLFAADTGGDMPESVEGGATDVNEDTIRGEGVAAGFGGGLALSLLGFGALALLALILFAAASGRKTA